jgi:hypothetical protein
MGNFSMELSRLLIESSLILTEAAVVEVIAHSTPDHLHPDLYNAPMVDTRAGRQALVRLYTAFDHVTKPFDLPLILATPTWWASQDRSRRSAQALDEETF